MVSGIYFQGGFVCRSFSLPAVYPVLNSSGFLPSFLNHPLSNKSCIQSSGGERRFIFLDPTCAWKSRKQSGQRRFIDESTFSIPEFRFYLTQRNPFTLPRKTSRLFLNCTLFTLSRDSFMSPGVNWLKACRSLWHTNWSVCCARRLRTNSV